MHTVRRSRTPLKTATIALATAAALALTGCSAAGPDAGEAGASAQSGAPMLATSGPETLADADGTGLDVTRRFFEAADELVVATIEADSQRAAATEAVERGVPMLVFTGDNGQAIVDEAARLGAGELLTAGEFEIPEAGGLDVTALAVETAETPASPEAEAEAEAGATATATESDGPDGASDPALAVPPSDQEDPAQAAHDGDPEILALARDIASLAPARNTELTLPPLLVTEQTSPAALATAKAAGGQTHLLSFPDPRITSQSMDLVQGGDTIALGAQFGSTEEYAEKVDLAANGELPGGGGLAFPGRRMIAMYGHPSGDALGVMGEQSPTEAVERLRPMVEQYQALEEQPVIPAFEIIVTVASEFPGEDGDYSNEGAPEDFVGYIDAITEAGGYAVLDLQPGRASFLEQAKRYEELLKRPNVGLAIDPEWQIGADEMPMQRIGNTTAAEVDEVARWLADLTRENDLPQKVFIVHQFQLQMVRDREQIDTSHPELAFVIHADGHGTPDLKFETWNVLRQGLSDDWFMAWKNFIDEDTPTFTPEQTYETVNPRPWFVSYQ